MNLRELTQDGENANRGTQRGEAELERSISTYGLGRSILVDRNGTIIAGNKTAQKAGELGLDDVVVVQTTGNQLVAVQRTDLDLDTDDEARELAYADNKVGELDLDWDPDQVLKDAGRGVSVPFTDKELEQFEKEQAEKQGRVDGEISISPELFERHDYLVFYFDNDMDWQVVCERFGIQSQRSVPKPGGESIGSRGVGRVVSGSELLKKTEPE